jgi:hypothetical protein
MCKDYSSLQGHSITQDAGTVVREVQGKGNARPEVDEDALRGLRAQVAREVAARPDARLEHEVEREWRAQVRLRLGRLHLAGRRQTHGRQTLMCANPDAAAGKPVASAFLDMQGHSLVINAKVA